MRLNDGELVMLHSRSVYGMASCDLVSWLTLTAGGGQSQVKPEDFDPYGDNKAMWMAGAKWTIWDFPLSEPPWLMSLFRVETSVSYWQNKAVLMDQDMDWHEWRGTLTVSAERYVEEWGKDSTVIPYSLLFYAGCAYSQVGGDVHLSPAAATAAGTDKMGFDEEDSFAVIGGIDFFISHNLSIGAEARAFISMKENVLCQRSRAFTQERSWIQEATPPSKLTCIFPPAFSAAPPCRRGRLPARTKRSS